ncbi:nuclease-related domain-containing protein [Frigoribacterium sp. 2-23]|uniref:nuclease-related domain-containing protein n=1 Tax=Frigoribacterium sp. 2-23 TaxID=3415006 RepID=UPI003C6EC24E
MTDPQAPSRASAASADPDLDQSDGGHGALAHLWRLQQGRPRRSLVGRLFGTDPLLPDARRWFAGVEGELEVARLLSTLGNGWRTIHTVPIGDDADVDHVVIGPGGVFTVTTKSHVAGNVWVGERAVLVDGYRQPYLPTARFQAERVSELLGRASARHVAVEAVVVVANAKKLTVASMPRGVTVVTAAQLVAWLRRRPATLDIDCVRHITRAALQRSTWRPSAQLARAMGVTVPHDDVTKEARAETADPAELRAWWQHLRGEVATARRVRTAWSLLVPVGAVLGALAVPPAIHALTPL